LGGGIADAAGQRRLAANGLGVADLIGVVVGARSATGWGVIR